MTATRGAATDRPATSKDRPQAALGRTPSRLPTPAVQAAAVRRTADEQSSRGRVTIAKVVIEKLAGQAAAEIRSAGGKSGGVLGLGAHSDLSARPSASVELSGDSADIALSVAIAYPTSIRQATQQVREHVRDRVSTLSGLQVRRVDIEVVSLLADDATTAGGPVGRAQRALR